MERIIKCVWSIFVLFAMCDVILMAPQGRVKFRRRSDISGRGRRKCSEWIFGVCLPSNGTCSKGFKLGQRSGDCKVKEKQFKCELPCMDSLTNTDITNVSGHRSGKKDNVEPNQKESKLHRKNRHKKKRKNRRKGNKDCRYARGRWTPCDPSNNKRTRISVLKRGNPQECPQIKTVERKCKEKKGKKGCKYRKSESSFWSDCDPQTNKMSIVLALRKGDPGHCQPEKIMHKPCRQKGKKMRPKKRCKYSHSKWSPCDPATNTTSRIFTLKRSSPKECEATKVIRKACKKVCRYTKGKWTKCDPTSKSKERVGTLTPESHATCPPTRKHIKQCHPRKPRNKCQYDYGSWSDCIEGKRTRTRNLKAESPGECAPSKISQKSCTLRNGEERCFFGPWGEYGSCQNGVKTKTRPVIAGGDNCHRRGVKTKPCPAH